jgi:hypothetical protein
MHAEKKQRKNFLAQMKDWGAAEGEECSRFALGSDAHKNKINYTSEE